MNALLHIGLSNIALAALLALPAVAASRWGRRPALAHGLWLLVLLKLITPPLWELPVAWGTPPEPEPVLVANPPLKISEPGDVAPPAPAASLPEEDIAPLIAEVVDAPPPAIEPEEEVAPAAPEAAAPASAFAWPSVGTWAGLWLSGSALWLGLALHRLRGFRRWLRFAEPAPAELQARADALAQAMKVRPLPVLLVPGRLTPMLWAPGLQPQLVLPRDLLARLSEEAIETLLAHELAHWRRGDHWVRWLEVVVLGGYWWCPLAWWARRELQQAEEECCDAWVVELLPASARAYALALIETLDFLSPAHSAVPASASGIGHVRLFKRRLTMILRGKTPHGLTIAGLLGLVGTGALLLPLMPTQAQSPTAPVAVQPRGDERPRNERADRPVQDRGREDRAGQDEHGHDVFQGQQETAEQLRREIQRIEKAMRLQREQAEANLMNLRRQLDILQLDRARAEAQLQRARTEANAAQAGNALPRPVPGEAGPRAGASGGGSAAFGSGGVGGRGGSIAMGKTTGSRTNAPDFERRLSDVERKLDQLLHEIRDLRQEMQPGRRGPAGLPGGAGPGFPPAGQPGRGFSPPASPAPRTSSAAPPATVAPGQPLDPGFVTPANPVPAAPIQPTPSVAPPGASGTPIAPSGVAPPTPIPARS